jgi:DNA-binding GntR family transcriptional regulator
VARSDQAAEAIRDWIIDGTLPPGTPLVEGTLARTLGVSRVPVREALQRLSQQGLVQLRPGQSAQVVRRSARDVIELLEIRAVLAGFAAGLAAERRTEEDLAVLSQLIDDARSAVDVADWHQVGVLNSRFHTEVAKISGNAQLSAIIESSRFQLAWLNQHMARKRGHKAWQVYEELVEALREGDAQAADEISRLHILATKDAFAADYLAGNIST